MNLPKAINVFSAILVTGLLFTTTALAVNPPPQATTSGKLQACQTKEKSIKQRSVQLVDLSTKMESRFDNIATQVENYYVNRVVTAGKAVSNYESLVTAIQTQKNTVSSALGKTRSDTANLSCRDNPKVQIVQFRTDMQAVKTALKNYRTAIKNLIVAVHSAGGGENSSVKPTASPR